MISDSCSIGIALARPISYHVHMIDSIHTELRECIRGCGRYAAGRAIRCSTCIVRDINTMIEDCKRSAADAAPNVGRVEPMSAWERNRR